MKANEPTENEKYVAENYVVMHRKFLEYLLFMGFMLYTIQEEADKETRLKLLKELSYLYNETICNYLTAVGMPAQAPDASFGDYARSVINRIYEKQANTGFCSLAAEMAELITERQKMCSTIIVEEITRAEATEYRNRN